AVDRRRDPIRLYGVLELGVGASALLTAAVASHFEPLHAWAASRFAADSPALAALRLALASVLVLPPTLCMGATLPVMTRALVKRLDELGRKLSLLYALNTAGAVAGCLLAGFALIGTSTYAFATMLVAFLIGIALGSFLVHLLDARIDDPRRVFGWVQLGIVFATLLSIPLLGTLVTRGQYWLLGLEQKWVALFAARFGLAFAVMLLPATLVGMSFSLASRIGVHGLGRLGRELGGLYGANTLGNIAGALLGGFVLIPLVGLQRGIALLVLLNLAAAACALLPTSRGFLRAAPLAAALCCCAVFLAAWKPRPFQSIEESGEDAVLY